jgi:hypothetical protein
MPEPSLPVYPFDPQRCIGTISEIGPNIARANLPCAVTASGQWLYGSRIGAGEVGEFVLIECSDAAIFARVINVRLPGRDRLSVEPEIGGSRDAHPVGTLQLLTTILLKDGSVTGGIAEYPRLGAKVYAAHPSIVKWLSEAARHSSENPEPIVIDLARLAAAQRMPVCVTPERLFGRHCAVLGATGGGKSWSVARLIEQSARYNSKVVLFDATGEFHPLMTNTVHVYLGADPSPLPSSKEVSMPYFELTEGDLFGLFKPSGQIQAPRLRAAMKSLKLARLAPELATNGLIVKANKQKKPYDTAYMKHIDKIESPRANFDLTRLNSQILEECVWMTGTGNNASVWGNTNEQERAYCVTLITRIEDLLSQKSLECILKPGSKESLNKSSVAAPAVL